MGEPHDSDRGTSQPETSRGQQPSPDPGSEVPGAESSEATASLLMLAELERRVRSLESRVNELGRFARAPRWQVKPSDVVRWALWLLVIGFLAFYWKRFGAPR